MRILYIDCDSTRPDHLGCYGYGRPTSPNIDRIAAQGVRLDQCYASDVPCLPSRTTLFSGRFGTRTGVVNHGGAASSPHADYLRPSSPRSLNRSSWPACLRRAGLRTATVSSFGERHSALHFYAGFNDILNNGRHGMDTADEVLPLAAQWLAEHGRSDDWFLHVNFWDAHIPYRAPNPWIDRFADEPLPDWPDAATIERDWRNATGSFSPREICGHGGSDWEQRIATDFPRQPLEVGDRDGLRRMIDGYDGGIRYADEHIGRLLNQLADLDVLDETAIIISADHGENLGELAIYGDHQTADQGTARVPMIVRWPGVTGTHAGAAIDGLHYAFDVAAATIDLCGGEVPGDWDARSCAAALRDPGLPAGRDHLVIATGTSTVQRSVRFGDHLLIRTWHDGFHLYPDWMLYDLASDPHEQHNLAREAPSLLGEGARLIDAWLADALRRSPSLVDPLQQALRDGGPFYTWGRLDRYLDRLRSTDRGEQAAALAARHRPVA